VFEDLFITIDGYRDSEKKDGIKGIVCWVIERGGTDTLCFKFEVCSLYLYCVAKNLEGYMYRRWCVLG